MLINNKNHDMMSTKLRKNTSKNDGSTYAKQINKIKPRSSSRLRSVTSSALNSDMEYNTSIKAIFTTGSKLTNVKTIMARLTGVGHIAIPKDIKQQKWMISMLLTILFMIASIINGVIIYGIEKVIHDQCYSPFNKIYYNHEDNGYICPSFSGGFIKKEYAPWVRLFEIGSTIHTISLGFAMSGVYYLNFYIILLYVTFFLIGLTLMVMSVLIEILIVKAGLLIYFNLPNGIVVSFLVFFLIDVINLFASINLQVRWINFLNS